MRVKETLLEDIKPYENNPRQNDEAVKAVAVSIAEFGWKQPIVVDADGVIIVGHTRLKAAQRLGLATAPVVVADDLTPEQTAAYRLADNKTAELAEWDMDKLALELDGLATFDMEQFGFDASELEYKSEAEQLVEDDFDEELPEEPATKPGDIYQLGDHRLMCGDATSSEAVFALMGGGTADCYVTDPPYGVSYVGWTDERLTIENDNIEGEEFVSFLTGAFHAADSVMRQGASFYIWHASSKEDPFIDAMDDIGWKIRQTLVWNKNTFALGRQDYQWKHEPCFYGWKDGAAHYFVEDRTNTTVQEVEIPDLSKATKDELRLCCQRLLKQAEKTPTTVIDEDKPARNAEHPTMKPVRLIGQLVANSTLPGQNVLDTFGGSGTTLIACEQLGRNCYMMELDPAYCDVIIHRWEEYTGGKAEKITA